MAFVEMTKRKEEEMIWNKFCEDEAKKDPIVWIRVKIYRPQENTYYNPDGWLKGSPICDKVETHYNLNNGMPQQ